MKFASFETSYATDMALKKYRASQGEVHRLLEEIEANGGTKEATTELLDAFNKACDLRDRDACYLANCVTDDFEQHGG